MSYASSVQVVEINHAASKRTSEFTGRMNGCAGVVNIWSSHNTSFNYSNSFALRALENKYKLLYTLKSQHATTGGHYAALHPYILMGML